MYLQRIATIFNAKFLPAASHPPELPYSSFDCSVRYSSVTISYMDSGVFRIWQRGGHGERAERKPITGVWGQSPQRGPGAEPLVGGSGGEAPLKLKHFLLLNVQWKQQICPFFWNLETQKTIKRRWILQFLLKNGKKRTFSYKVACKKFSWSGQRGGIGPWPSPYATVYRPQSR